MTWHAKVVGRNCSSWDQFLPLKFCLLSADVVIVSLFILHVNRYRVPICLLHLQFLLMFCFTESHDFRILNIISIALLIIYCCLYLSLGWYSSAQHKRRGFTKIAALFCDIDAVFQLSATDGFGNQPRALVWQCAMHHGYHEKSIQDIDRHTYTKTQTYLLERHQLPWKFIEDEHTCEGSVFYKEYYSWIKISVSGCYM